MVGNYAVSHNLRFLDFQSAERLVKNIVDFLLWIVVRGWLSFDTEICFCRKDDGCALEKIRRSLRRLSTKRMYRPYHDLVRTLLFLYPAFLK